MEQDIYQLIAERATCRSYRPDPIPDEVLNRILEAGCKSPSGGGFQALSIIKITDPEKPVDIDKFSCLLFINRHITVLQDSFIHIPSIKVYPLVRLIIIS